MNLGLVVSDLIRILEKFAFEFNSSLCRSSGAKRRSQKAADDRV